MSYSIFQSQYTWPEELNDKVYKSWKKKASERLRDMVFKAMKETICDWMTVDMRRRVLALKSTDEFKKKSTQNRKNKVTGPKAGTLHTSGSISASQWARRMVLVTYLSLLIINYVFTCKCSNKYYMSSTLS